MATRTLHPPIQPGQRFGRWTILSPAGWQTFPSGKSFPQWTCQCDCGTVREVLQYSLTRGVSVSCGCYNRERSVAANTTHGESTDRKKSPEYKAWQSMLVRCFNPKNPRYADYGGRGVTVCEEWRYDFSAFLAEIGRRPTPQHSLDRIENDRGYEPGNVRWATAHEQMTNRRITQLVDGVPLATLAKQHKIPANTLRFRILKGWDLQEALTKPVRAKRSKRQEP